MNVLSSPCFENLSSSSLLNSKRVRQRPALHVGRPDDELVADTVADPHVRELIRRVAALITRVGPVLAIEVEVVGGEQVHGQRLDPRRRLRVRPLRPDDPGPGQERGRNTY